MANRYARTVGGNWTADATWSTTSGGAADTVAPTASDDVFLDANSGNVTISATSVGKSLTCTGYTGTLTHNASITITISGNVTMVAGMTYSPAATSTFQINGTGTLTTGGKLFPNITLNNAVTVTLGDNLNFMDSKVLTMQFTGNQLALGGFTVSGFSATSRILIRSNTLGTPRTITNTTGTFANADFKDITFSTNADYSAITGLSGDCGGNSGATLTTGTTRTYTGGTGSWSDSTKWTGGVVPLPQDDVSMSGVTGGTITADMPRLGKSIDWTGASGTPAWADSVAHTIYGSVTLISGMSISSFSDGTTLEGRSTFTITASGKSWPSGNITMSMFGGTLTMNDAWTSVGGITINNGTFITSGFSYSGLFVSSAGSSTRAITLSTSTLTLSQTTGNAWNLSTVTGMTLSAGTSTILLSDTGASSKTFAGGGLTYNDLKLAGGGAGAVIITGSNSFARLPQIAGGTKTLQITAGTTQTFRSVGVEGFGNGSNVITIQSTSGGSTYTFSRASGIVSADYISLQDSIATGGAEWYAGANSTNVSGNTGWYFTIPQIVSSENLTKAGTTWVWGLDPNSYAYGALLQQEWVPSSSNATIGNNGLLTSAHLRKEYGNLTFFKDYGSGSSSVDADFAAGSPTGTWTVTRSATTPATTIDSQGRIQIVQHTGPRFTQGFYDSTGFVSRPGLIVEGASTNLNPYSISTAETAGKLDNWNPATGGTIGGTPTWSTVTPSIYPTAKAQRVRYTGIASDAGRLHLNLVTVAVTAGTTYTGSIFLRSQNGSGAQVAISIQELDGTATNILQNITVTSSWARYQIQRTMGAGVTQARLTVGFVNGTPIVEGVVVDLEGACPQIEALPFASTFIPTTTAALTRNAETLTYPIASNRTAATESIFIKGTPFYGVSGATSNHGMMATDTKTRILRVQNTSGKFRFKPNETDETSVLAEVVSPTVTAFTSFVVGAVCQHSSPYASLYADGGNLNTYVAGDFTSNAWGTNFGVGGDASTRLDGIISSIAIFSDAKDATAVANITRTLQ